MPSLITDLSATASSNSPPDTEQRTTADDYYRAHAAFIRQLYDTQVGGQIVFPATQNASANANTLDDYEEGTWTPTITAGSGTITTYTSDGKYTKIGNTVMYTATAIITTKGSAAGSMTCTLPFTSAVVACGTGVEINNTGKSLNGIIAVSASVATWRLYDGTTPFVANGDIFYMTGHFQV